MHICSTVGHLNIKSTDLVISYLSKNYNNLLYRSLSVIIINNLFSLVICTYQWIFQYVADIELGLPLNLILSFKVLIICLLLHLIFTIKSGLLNNDVMLNNKNSKVEQHWMKRCCWEYWRRVKWRTTMRFSYGLWGRCTHHQKTWDTASSGPRALR